MFAPTVKHGIAVEQICVTWKELHDLEWLDTHIDYFIKDSDETKIDIRYTTGYCVFVDGNLIS